MRLKEQPIAPAIGTEKTGPRSNAISRSCFFRSFRRFWQIETSATSSSPSRSNTIALSHANRRHRMPGAKSLRKRHSTSPSRTDRTSGPLRLPSTLDRSVKSGSEDRRQAIPSYRFPLRHRPRPYPRFRHRSAKPEKPTAGPIRSAPRPKIR